MLKIKRLVNGQKVEFELTQVEIKEVFRQNNIQWAKDILQNYEGIIVDYEYIIADEEQLIAFAELLDKKNLENNSERELEAISELFGTAIEEDFMNESYKKSLIPSNSDDMIITQNISDFLN